jgi:hypothetical protein
MDARLLWSGHGLQAIRYALQYTLKRQTELDNAAIVELAFNKRVAREAGLRTTAYGLGVGRLMSLSYASAGVMEIGAPLATTIILEGESVHIGCVFEKLVLVEGLNILNDIPVEATVVSRDHQLFAEISIVRYTERPGCLELLSWFDFCCWCRKIGPPESDGAMQCAFRTSNRGELRPHLPSHGYRYSDYPRVPDIIGPRLPDSSRLGNEDYLEKTELYYRAALLLHHPFRSVAGFLDDEGSAKTAFDEWRPFEKPDVARVFERHQHYYDCLQAAQDYREKQVSSTNESDDEAICLHDDILPVGEMQTDDAHRLTNDVVSFPPELYDADIDIRTVPPRSTTIQLQLNETPQFTGYSPTLSNHLRCRLISPRMLPQVPQRSLGQR